MAIYIFLLGLIIGSFLNVCIYRVPRGESLSFPPSHCPGCQKKLSPVDLIPVFSFVLLKAKCRYCGNKISWRYPLIELLTGLTFLLCFSVSGLNPILIKYLFIACVLTVVTFIDLEHYIIPNKIVVFTIISGIILNFIIPDLTWGDALAGLVAGGGVLLLLAMVSRGGMGGGDIKLAAALGLLFGWQKVLLALFLGSILAGVLGLILILAGRKSRKDMLPFGPFIALGSLVAMLWGYKIINWYLYQFWKL